MANRILFQTPETAFDAIHIMQIGHVMLEPFPITGHDDDDVYHDDEDKIDTYIHTYIHRCCFLSSSLFNHHLITLISLSSLSLNIMLYHHIIICIYAVVFRC